MSRFVRRTTTLAILGALAVGAGLPAAAQSGRAQHVSQRQSILTELSPTGEVGTSRVFTQLRVQGDGPVTVSLPAQSTSGLRSLDGFGSPDVDGDEVIWSLDASGRDGAQARTVADNTAELPVSVSVVYRLDGQEVDPADLVGKDGEVEVEYTVRNLTAEPRDVISFDAENNKHVETMDVAVPMVGTLALTLPPSFVDVRAPGGVTAGDGRGNTVVNFSLLLFSPLGSEEQVVSWTAASTDTAIPESSIQVLPVDDRSFGSLNATADAYKGASESLTTLANGALIINSNLQLLGAGASQLLDGLNQLSDGADQLSDGLANTAAPGARQLSDGLSKARAGGGELSTGLGELALGATRLSDGLGDARSGGGQLASGLGDLALGATRLAGGLGDALSGGRRLQAGIEGLPATVGAGIEDALGETLQGVVLPSLATNLEGGLQENLQTALLGQFSPNVVAGLGPGLDAALTQALQEQLEPQLTAGMGPGLRDALTQALQGQLEPQLTAGLQQSLTAALQQPPVGLDAGTAAAVAQGFGVQAGPMIDQAFADFAAQFGPGFAAGFAPQLDGAFAQFAAQFGPGFAAGFAPQLDGAFAAFADVFGPAFASGFAPNLDAGLTSFAALFAPAFADGFAAQVAPNFDTLATQFGAGFAAGLAEGLEEEALPGFRQLNAGLGQLSDGGRQLAAGAGTARDGAGALASGLGQLDDGGEQLAAGAGRASSGSRDLASGLGQLDDGAAKLADGLGDAADGSTRIADGLDAASEGGQKVADGTVKLSEGLEGQLIAGVSAGRQGASQDHEQVRAVIARGREGASPYGVADGAESTTVFAFDVAGVGDQEGGPSTPLVATLAAVALAAAGALGTGLKRRLIA